MYEVQCELLQDIPTTHPIAPENKTYSESTTEALRTICIIIQSPHSRRYNYVNFTHCSSNLLVVSEHFLVYFPMVALRKLNTLYMFNLGCQLVSMRNPMFVLKNSISTTILFIGFLKKSYSEKIHKIFGKTYLEESLFRKAARVRTSLTT